MREAARLEERAQISERTESTLREDLERDRARADAERERSEKLRRELEATIEAAQERIEELQRALEEASRQTWWESFR